MAVIVSYLLDYCVIVGVTAFHVAWSERWVLSVSAAASSFWIFSGGGPVVCAEIRSLLTVLEPCRKFL